MKKLLAVSGKMVLSFIMISALCFGVGFSPVLSEFIAGLYVITRLGLSFVYKLPVGVLRADSEIELDPDELIAEFKKTYKKGTVTMKSIRTQLYDRVGLFDFFKKMPYENTIYTSIYLTMGEVLQAFSIPITPKGTETYQPWQQKIGTHKVDISRSPFKFWQTFLQFMVDIEKKDIATWTYCRWFLINHIIPQLKKDMERKAAFFGWEVTGYDASPTVQVSGTTFTRELSSPNVPSPTNASMDGIMIQLMKMVAHGRLDPYNGGAIPTDEVLFVGYIEDMVQSYPEELQAEVDFLNMNKTLYDRYITGRRLKYNSQYKDKQDSELNGIDKVDIKVQYHPGMKGSDNIWGTPASNRVRPVIAEMKNKWRLEAKGREIEFSNEWSEQITFDVPELIMSNEIDTVMTQSIIDTHYTESGS